MATNVSRPFSLRPQPGDGMAMMTKREHKLLMKDFERLGPSDAAAVTVLIGEHVKAQRRGHIHIFFCLEEVPLDDPILFKIRNRMDELRCSDRAEQRSFLDKTCVACGKQTGTKTCARCRRVHYCGRECQACDWKRHKPTCVPAAPWLGSSVG